MIDSRSSIQTSKDNAFREDTTKTLVFILEELKTLKTALNEKHLCECKSSNKGKAKATPKTED